MMMMRFIDAHIQTMVTPVFEKKSNVVYVVYYEQMNFAVFVKKTNMVISHKNFQ